jgi:hypothetical protein
LSRQAPFAINADLDFVFEQQAGEVDARELDALIRIEDFGPAVTAIPCSTAAR